MTVTVTLDRNQCPTKEQLEEIRQAAQKPVVYDDDSPELTDAMEKAFLLAARNRNRMRKIG